MADVRAYQIFVFPFWVLGASSSILGIGVFGVDSAVIVPRFFRPFPHSPFEGVGACCSAGASGPSFWTAAACCRFSSMGKPMRNLAVLPETGDLRDLFHRQIMEKAVASHSSPKTIPNRARSGAGGVSPMSGVFRFPASESVFPRFEGANPSPPPLICVLAGEGRGRYSSNSSRATW